MKELSKKIKAKYNDFSVTPQWLGKVIRDNNLTRKRTRKSHFPEVRYGSPINKQTELNNFYNVVNQYNLDQIICLDETSIQPSMIQEYSRCKIGRRCVEKTTDNIVFRKFTLLVAISYNGLIGYKLYEQGGMTGDRFVNFYNNFIKDKYKNHLIIMDNAGAHKKAIVKNTITNSENKYLYSVPYTPKTNAIEAFFNQVKYYMKLDRTLNFNQIKISLVNALSNVTKQNYENYFKYAYDKNSLPIYQPKKSTRFRKTPKYRE